MKKTYMMIMFGLMLLTMDVSIAATISTANLISYWKFNNETAYTDSFGANNLTNNGLTLVNSTAGICKIGGCINATAADNYAFTNSPVNLTSGAGSRSFGCWVNVTAYNPEDYTGYAYTGYFGYGTWASPTVTGWEVGLSTTGQNYPGIFMSDYDINANFAMPLNKWILVTSTYNATNNTVILYHNSTPIASSNSKTPNTLIGVLKIASLFNAGNRDITGYVDDCFFYNRTLSVPELVNLSTGIDILNQSNPLVPAVIFVNQSPSDITSTNLNSQELDIFYNLTNAGTNNISLWYLINSTVLQCVITGNGTCLKYNSSLSNTTFLLNTTPQLYEFELLDENVYPAVYGFPNQSYMQEIVKNSSNLSSVNDYLKVKITGLSNITQFNLMEIFLNTTSSSGLDVYYCNSTYTTGAVTTNNNCNIFVTILSSFTYNHTERNSSYILRNMPISSGNVGSVRMTNISYIVFKKTSGVLPWTYFFINNKTDVNVTQISSNGGTSYTELIGSIDMHFHQFNGTSSICYYASYLENGTYTNSTQRCDTFDVNPLPPSAVTFFSPMANTHFNDTMFINYSASVDPEGFTNINYDINLCYPINLSVYAHIHNNSNNLTYNASILTFADGNYTVCVSAFDNQSLSSISYSGQITIDKISPAITFNDMIGYQNETYSFNIGLYDVNLYAYQIDVYNPALSLIYTNNVSGLPQPSFTISDSFQPNVTGNYTVTVQASDSHTKKEIKDYQYTTSAGDIRFTFNDVKQNKLSSSNNVSILYTGKYLAMAHLNKSFDRYNFDYDFTLGNDDKLDEVHHKFRIECPGIDYIENSRYTAHFVCPVTSNWIDFMSDSVKSYSVTACESSDCYVVDLTTKPDKNIKFSSIGGLNKNTQTATLVITTRPPVNNLEFGVCPSSTIGMFEMIALYFILIVLFYFGIKAKTGALVIVSGVGWLVLTFTFVGCSLFLGAVMLLIATAIIFKGLTMKLL